MKCTFLSELLNNYLHCLYKNIHNMPIYHFSACSCFLLGFSIVYAYEMPLVLIFFYDQLRAKVLNEYSCFQLHLHHARTLFVISVD